jgi:hypothetical protein
MAQYPGDPLSGRSQAPESLLLSAIISERTGVTLIQKTGEQLSEPMPSNFALLGDNVARHPACSDGACR